MSSPKKNLIIDPDYEISEIAKGRVRLKEQRDSKEKLQKVTEILNREFQTELNHRQSQLELIQQRLNQAQKTLHLLRYVLITSYYNESEKLASELDEASTSTRESLISDKSRLHPAVKRLLQNSSVDLNLAKTPRKKMKHSYYPKEKPKSSCTQTKNDDIEIAEPENVEHTEVEENEAVKLTSSKEEFDITRNRNKYKYHIRVGNISKWNPSDSKEDKSTHKWMVYVRGPKENPDISHLVRKVVFYLHPSYHPNDVIEIKEPPFHLSRRGWGEFRVRARLYFHCNLNKPVDIYHDLKLDQTFSGRQQLANETARDLYLYNDNEDNGEKIEDISEQTPTTPIVKEEIDENDFILEHNIKDEITIKEETEFGVSHYEHDYCYSNMKEEVEEPRVDCNLSIASTSASESISSTSSIPNFLTEHSYFNITPSSNATFEVHNQNANFEQDSDLMYGIQETEENQNDLIVETVLDDVRTVPKPKSQYTFQRLVMSNGKIFEIRKRKKTQQSLLKKIFQKKYIKEMINAANIKEISVLENVSKNNDNSLAQANRTDGSELIDYDKYKVNVPSHRFKNAYEVLPYLFKRLPLITNFAVDTNYKCTYPYVAKSLEEYSNWNIGRRLSSEWYQAKTVQKIINSLNFPDSKNWTTKSLIMYARSHGYTPLCTYAIFKNKMEVFKELTNGGATKAENGISNKSKSKNRLTEMEEDTIDVESLERLEAEMNNSNKLNSKERLIDYKMGSVCSYVKQAVLDVGIVLKSEEIISGVLYNAAERMLLQASLSLAEDLIRKARSSLVLQGDFREDVSTIGVEEIRKALSQRTEFNIISTRKIV